MYAKARQGELSDLSEPVVALVRCASELNLRVLLSPEDPRDDPDPRNQLRIEKLVALLLRAPASLLPEG